MVVSRGEGEWPLHLGRDPERTVCTDADGDSLHLRGFGALDITFRFKTE